MRATARPTSLSEKTVTWRWSDPTVRGLVWQALVVLVLLGLGFWLWRNLAHNLEVRHISTGFGFLSRQAGMPIADAIAPYNPSDSYLWALTVGLFNTLRVAIVGIVLATILGVVIGISRLSKNWLVAKVAAVYVEVLRDLPLLLQILLWYLLLQKLPVARQSFEPLPNVYVSNRGLVVPTLDWAPAHAVVMAAVVIACVCAWLWSRDRLRRRMLDGRPRRAWPVALLLIVALPAFAAVLSGAQWTVVWPQLRGFNFIGGTTLSPEYVALLVALTSYTAAFIAEIVRAGILAVSRGQWEAAEALGLRRSTAMRLIVLPQALRVILPPLTSQYLNLTKNSSLSVVIGFQDVVSVANTMLNQTGQAIEAIGIIMLVFLSISLSISLLMNWYNARIALVER